MNKLSTITPCLWFHGNAEEAANFYISIFQNSEITSIGRYSEAGYDIHQHHAGSVMVVSFTLDGQSFTALNGGPQFAFTEAVSLQVACETQEEVDYYWEKLSAGGEPAAQECGWLKDRYGLSWQVVPSIVIEMLRDHTSPKAMRAMDALLQMKKIDIAKLKRAYEG